MSVITCIHRMPEASEKRTELRLKICKTFSALKPNSIKIHGKFSEINVTDFLNWINSNEGETVIKLTEKQYINFIKRLSEEKNISCNCSRNFILEGFRIKVK